MQTCRAGEPMKVLHCPTCHSRVYFENTLCLQCQTPLGFELGLMDMTTFGEGTPFRPCANRAPQPVCNWLVAVDDPQALCMSCRLTSTIAPLSNEMNFSRWIKVESAKRLLLYSLQVQGIALRPKQSPDDTFGVEFRWLESQNGTEVVTGHENGVITLNIHEVDDGRREAERERLHEYMRTVLGHLRHETSHHLYQRFIENKPVEVVFRDLFGDDRADYGQALVQHYENGPPANWEQNYVSAYASSHPLEDWAETAAHYLLMFDALETAKSERVEIQGFAIESADPNTTIGDIEPADNDAITAKLVRQEWLPLARFLNTMSRSLGQRDYYPFVLSDVVIRKLAFVRSVFLGTETFNQVV